MSRASAPTCHLLLFSLQLKCMHAFIWCVFKELGVFFIPLVQVPPRKCMYLRVPESHYPAWERPLPLAAVVGSLAVSNPIHTCKCAEAIGDDGRC